MSIFFSFLFSFLCGSTFNLVLMVAVSQDIDLKALVYEAYQKGAQELLYVVPFTAKVLESCAKSKVRAPYASNCFKQDLCVG